MSDKKTMRLLLLHGSKRADRTDIEEWGHNGPTLNGITAFHVTYLATFNIYFATKELGQRAHEQTGWKWWDEDCGALIMPFVDELVVVYDGMEGSVNWAVKGEPGPSYYGDFEFQTSNNEGKDVG